MAEPVRFQHFEVARKEDGSLFELGRGAMGITYKAYDTNLRCQVCLKVINSAFLNSETARQRFLREARAAAALRHPNVATVFHLGNEGENYFYAMEFVDGETVEAFMKREGAIPPVLALEIASQVCRALGAAERQGLVHRDIKPSNLMLVREADGELTVKVIDFGLAKVADRDGEDTATLTLGGFLGTPHFASPEQLEERDIDVRSDIYSLGVTLWYMLVGKAPFTGSLAQVMSQHLHSEPPFEFVENQPPALVALLRRMMEKDPAKRPRSAAELRKEIEKCLEAIRRDFPVSAPAGPAGPETFETAVLSEAVSSSAIEFVPGAVVAGRYRLVREKPALEHGRLFEADADGHPVGLLVLDPHLLKSSGSYTRLENEVEAFQKLSAAAFWKIFSLERAHHQSFLVLEPIEGPALLDILRARRALSAAEVLHLLGPLGEAFDTLADAGLPCPGISLHEIFLPGGNAMAAVDGGKACQPKFLPISSWEGREISPDATLVASPLVVLQKTGAFAGKPGAPFVFSLATLAYELLGGIRGGAYVPIAGLSEAGNATLRRALTPGDSFAGCQEFLRSFAAGAETRAPRIQPKSPEPPDLPSTQVPPRKPPKGLLTSLIVVVCLVFGLGLGVFLSQKSKSEPVPPAPLPPPAPSPTPVADGKTHALAAAEGLLARGDKIQALEAYADLAEKYPGEEEPKIAMRQIVEGLDPNMPAQEFSSWRPSLEKAADFGILPAQLLLGDALRKSDPASALRWQLAAAGAGNPQAMVQAAQMIAAGEGRSADPAEAAVWFVKAAEAGDADGSYHAAVCYLTARGVEKNPAKAVELLQKAAGTGNPKAMNLLGDLNRRGIPGVLSPDVNEAFRLFSKAQSLGVLDAQGNLGVLYLRGEGVTADPVKAAGLFLEGAQKGNPFCMYLYAACLEDGIGLPASAEEAKKWYIQSAQAGHKPAMAWCREKKISYAAPESQASPSPVPAGETPSPTPGGTRQ